MSGFNNHPRRFPTAPGRSTLDAATTRVGMASPRSSECGCSSDELTRRAGSANSRPPHVARFVNANHHSQPLPKIDGPSSGGPSVGGIDSKLPYGLDFCESVEFDEYYLVPEYFYDTQEKPYIIASAGAEYYYRCAPATCRWFVVDIGMASYSNTNGNPDELGQLYIDAGAFDLPSSGAFGLRDPSTVEDCGRLEIWVRYYRRLWNESIFTLQGSMKTTGDWSVSTCKRESKGSSLFPIYVFRSPSGVDRHRIVVRVKLRNSGQEAGVYLWTPEHE